MVSEREASRCWPVRLQQPLSFFWKHMDGHLTEHKTVQDFHITASTIERLWLSVSTTILQNKKSKKLIQVSFFHTLYETERLNWLLCNICCTLSSIFVFHTFPWTLEAETDVWYEVEWTHRIMYIWAEQTVEDCFHMHLLVCAHFLCVQRKSNFKMPAWCTWARHVTSQINSGHIYSPEQVT